MLTKLFLIALLLFQSASFAAEVVLREEAASPAGQLVRLGDVAEVSGYGAEELRSLPLMPTPGSGGEVISAQSIRSMLAAQGIASAGHRFSGAFFVRVSPTKQQPDAAPTTRTWRPTSPSRSTNSRTANSQSSTAFRVRPESSSTTAGVPTARVSRRYRQAAEALVLDAIQAEVDRQANTDPEADRLAVASVTLSETAIRELGGKLPTDVQAELPREGAEPGNLSAQVTTGEETFRAVAKIVRQPMRVVIDTPVQRGDTLIASTVRLEPTPLEQLDRPGAIGFQAIDQVIGLEANRPLRTGEVVSATNTSAPRLVGRGEEVEVSAGGGGVMVRVRAVAKQDGRKGDLIPIETIDRGERLMARVVGPRRLAILTAGPSSDGLLSIGGPR